MKKLFLLALTFPLLALAPGQSGQQGPFSLDLSSGQNLQVNNRILARVNDKSISVLDVMKQMDLFFLREYPEYSKSPKARYQFYSTSWRQVLSEMVNKELILAEARQIKLPVEKAEVRAEMERIFGHNLVQKLAEVGFTYDEAWNMVRDELLYKRMIAMRVNTKAMQEIGPRTIRRAYRNLSYEQTDKMEWSYRVLSIRSPYREHLDAAADVAARALRQHADTLDVVKEKLDLSHLPDDVSVTVSNPLHMSGDQMSDAHREALQGLCKGEISPPIQQVNRRDNQLVYRIFHLVDVLEPSPPEFSEISKTLENKLFAESVAMHTETYVEGLRKRYHVEEDLDRLVPRNFQPFELN